MNRRSFLQFLGIGAVATPLAVKAVEEAKPIRKPFTAVVPAREFNAERYTTQALTFHDEPFTVGDLVSIPVYEGDGRMGRAIYRIGHNGSRVRVYP